MQQAAVSARLDNLLQDRGMCCHSMPQACCGHLGGTPGEIFVLPPDAFNPGKAHKDTGCATKAQVCLHLQCTAAQASATRCHMLWHTP